MSRARRCSPRSLTYLITAILPVTFTFGVITGSLQAQRQPLDIAFGPQGVQAVRYNNIPLEDIAQYPADNFHIWHLQMTDLQGKTLSTGQFGWGENNNSKVWNASDRSWTYSFVWGSIRVRFVPDANSLGIDVIETNKPGSGVILDGASIYPLVLHFPQLPAGFENATYPQLSDGVSGPSVKVADYGSGMVAAVVPDASKPLYSGFMPAAQVAQTQQSPQPRQAIAYAAIVSSAPPPGLAVFQPHVKHPVHPGETDHFMVSLRFAASGSPLALIAGDAYRNWSNSRPSTLHWKDRRMIGTVYLASSPRGDPKRPQGYPNNPRRYFQEDHADKFDVNTQDGLLKFQKRILDQAAAVVVNLKKLNAQGAITWDIEGEEYPQETSYVCSPDQIANVAPEMESKIQDQKSKYAGMKLDDAYFKTIRDGGFRVGVCVRPQHFKVASDHSAQQSYLSADQVAGELIRKVKYAHDRWGATLFYLDSTVGSDGSLLDAGVLKTVAEAVPDSLIIPEESNRRDYANTAPFHDFLFHGRLGTDPEVRNYYPSAFSAILLNDVDGSKLISAQGSLTNAVSHGDILMVHADYWQTNNAVVQAIYAAAHR